MESVLDKTRQLNEMEQQIVAYQNMGRPRAIRNLIATSNEPLITWALNNTGYSNDERRDYDEMFQEAYIMLLEAIDSWENHNYAFTTYYRYKVLNMKRKSNLYNLDTSLNAIISSEDDESELMDIVEDESAQDDLIEVEDEDERKQIREEVKITLKDKLGDTLGEKVTKMLFANYGIEQEEKTYKEIAEEYGVTGSYIGHQIQRARLKLMHNNKLRAIWAEYNNIDYMFTGSILEYGGSKTNRFNSVVESAALKRIELEQEIRGLQEESKDRVIESINRNYEIELKRLREERIQEEVDRINAEVEREKSKKIFYN